MLMKGGLAEDYPIPAHRESGDLDIWLFGQYAEGNRLMTQQNIRVDLHSPKHACFFFGGVPVENHRTFLNVTQYQIDRNLEKVLHRSLAEGRCSSLSLPEEASVLLPPPLFSAVFLARHLCVHFVSGIVLRHLCDWARFLSVHRGEFDTEEWTAAFREVGLLPVVQAFTRLAVEYLGLSREEFRFFRCSLRHGKSLYSMIFFILLFRYCPSRGHCVRWLLSNGGVCWLRVGSTRWYTGRLSAGNWLLLFSAMCCILII